MSHRLPAWQPARPPLFHTPAYQHYHTIRRDIRSSVPVFLPSILGAIVRVIVCVSSWVVPLIVVFRIGVRIIRNLQATQIGRLTRPIEYDSIRYLVQ